MIDDSLLKAIQEAFLSSFFFKSESCVTPSSSSVGSDLIFYD